jgi:DNA invertase Pin-like site-specific DNA recombinase
MIYTPRQSNDRLLLRLKGSLNEYELDLLRQRSVEARREKARRGELIVAAPAGYAKTEDQRLEKDPDRRVQEAVQRVHGMVFALAMGYWAAGLLGGEDRGAGGVTPDLTLKSEHRVRAV